MSTINSSSHSGLGLFGFTTSDNISMLGHDGFTLEYSAFVYYDVASKNTYSILVNQRDLNQISMSLIMEFIESLKNYTPTSIPSESTEPSSFVLNQNYPNPFNPTTMISFSLQKSDFVQLTIFNMLGKQIRTLVNGEQSSGKHTFMWNGKNDTGTTVASGTYIYHLKVGQRSESKLMLLIR